VQVRVNAAWSASANSRAFSTPPENGLRSVTTYLTAAFGGAGGAGGGALSKNAVHHHGAVPPTRRAMTTAEAI
jgi:hypothetical protein